MDSMVRTPSAQRTSRRLRLVGGADVVTALVWALFFISGLGQTVIVALLPRISVHDGLSDPVSALVLALPGLAMLTVSVPTGLLADRFGARRVTLAAGALLALGCAAQAGDGLDMLLAGRAMFGVAFGILWTAGAAWLAASGGGVGRVGPAVVAASVGTMIGPALGGLVGHGDSTFVPFTVVAAAAAVVSLALAAASRRVAGATGTGALTPTSRGPGAVLAPATRAPARRRPRRVAAARAAIAGYRRDRWLMTGIGSLAVAGALSGVTQLLIAKGLHADHVPESAIGLAFSACAVGYISVSAAFVRLGARARTLRINAIVTGLGATALLPALVSHSPTVLVGALLLTAAPRGAINVVAYGLVARSPRPGGSVFGLLNGAWGAATVLAPLAAGTLAEQFGMSAGYLAAIVPSLIIALALGATASSRRG
jgi:MFS family permease